MAQITRITSEALQATIRRLLPSQQGFGEDLQASNVITPIIDLTPTAEGSSLPTDLARALAFGSQTAFTAQGASVTVANTAGFHRIFACSTIVRTGGAVVSRFQMTDGLSTKTIWAQDFDGSAAEQALTLNVDFIVYLNSGESITAQTTNGDSIIQGSSRQVADVNGNIVVPSGFQSQ